MPSPLPSSVFTFIISLYFLFVAEFIFMRLQSNVSDPRVVSFEYHHFYFHWFLLGTFNLIICFILQLTAYTEIPLSQPTIFIETHSASSTSYSYSYSQSHAGCDYSNCSDAIIADIDRRDQDLVCAHPDLSCVVDCISMVLLEAHCACNTGLLFDDSVNNFNLFGEPYCCGSDACKDAVLNLYLATSDDAYALHNNTYALNKKMHDDECAAINCSASTVRPASSPSPVCDVE